uniref:Secreted protein n=1 Tax=Knipowitschia caucasica TaxID=637954 RepID=A0AAV2M6Q9_KNICA
MRHDSLLILLFVTCVRWHKTRCDESRVSRGEWTTAGERYKCRDHSGPKTTAGAGLTTAGPGLPTAGPGLQPERGQRQRPQQVQDSLQQVQDYSLREGRGRDHSRSRTHYSRSRTTA